MKKWYKYCAGLATIASLTPALRAQVPPPPPGAQPVTLQVVQAAPQKGLFERCMDAKAACKAALCQTPLGGLLNNFMGGPVGAMSGGLVPPLCPTVPSAADVDKARQSSAAEGEAAAIKKKEAEAKARRAAVRYLGTVDCHWYPAAEATLIGALRKDQNECVRLEAALALGRGCCCTKATIAALDDCVSGGEKFGPFENSDRVKGVAYGSLAHCLACVSEVTTPVETIEKIPVERAAPPVKIPTESGSPPKVMDDSPMAPYRKLLEGVSMEKVISDAHRTIAQATIMSRNNIASGRSGHSISEILSTAMGNRSGPENGRTRTTTNAPPMSPAAVTTNAPPMSPAPVTTSAPTPEIAPVPSATTSIPTVTTVPAVPSPVVPAKAPAATISAPVKETILLDVKAPAPSPEPEFPAPGATSATAKQMLAVLRKIPNAGQRQWAAENLASVNCQAEPDVIPALLKAAQDDAATTVRITCIRSLAKLGAYGSTTTSVLQSLQYDRDAGVRTEASLALSKLASSTPNTPYQTLMPVNATAPGQTR
jgi:hypothetical protein